jgi:hypothetical protein
MSYLKRRTALILALLVALAVVLAACGGSTASPAPAASPTPAPASSVAGDFVGVANSVDFIAISSNGQQIVAYACDGSAGHPITFAVWFKGAVSHNMVNLTAKNGAHLVAALTAQSAKGTVTLPTSKSFTFTANAITGTTGAGLYRSQETFGGVTYLAGWVLVVPPSAAVTSASAAPAFLGEWLVPLIQHGGGIINEQTGALLPAPALTAQDIAAGRVTVAGLGTFVLTPCTDGKC